jgi:hypothetical protein
LTYVEWLRVKSTLIRAAIVLGAIVAFAIVARICLMLYGPVDAVSYARSLQNDPGSHVVTRTLPGGATETTIDTSQGIRAVITDLGHGHKTVHIIADGNLPPRHLAIYGEGNMRHTQNGSHSDTYVETEENGTEGMAADFGVAGIAALIVGMMLAGCFARENDGHLEIALTRPISRSALALRMMLVDTAGVVAAWVMGVITFELVHLIFFGFFGFGINGRDVLLAIVVVLGALAWYAVLCCATASLKRNRGIILGTAWVAGIFIPVLAQLDSNMAPPFLVLKAIATPLSWIDPFTYARVTIAPSSMATTSHVYPYAVEIPILIALTLVYAVCAILQWRRVEA